MNEITACHEVVTRCCRWMCILIAISACTPSESPVLDGSDSVLAGTWEIQLYRKGSSQAEQVSGTIRLRHDPIGDSACSRAEDSISCRTHVRGTHDLELFPLLGHRQGESVSASLVDRQTMVLMIGECCDRGEIGATTTWREGRFIGRWVEGRIDASGAWGTLTMSRTSD